MTWGVVLKLAAALGVDCAAFQIRPASTEPASQGRPKGTTKKPAAPDKPAADAEQAKPAKKAARKPKKDEDAE